MVYINECIDVNTALKILQIYELFAYDLTFSKEFPMLASPRLYLVILSNLWLCPGGSVGQLLFRNPETEDSNPAPGGRKVTQHEPQDEEL